MNRRRIVIIAVVAALIVAALLTNGFGLFGRRDNGPLKLYGNVDIREVDMAFRVPGRIGSIAVDEGQKVTAGEQLAALDTATTDARLHQTDASVAQAQADLLKLRNGNRAQDVAQGRARLTSAEVALREAEQDVARRTSLVAPGAISKDLWQQTLAIRDKARAQLDQERQAYSLLKVGARREDITAGEAQLRAAQANRASAATDRGDTRLIAAEAGTVLTRAREPGAIVEGGETVLTISIDRPMRVRAYVAESDLSRISPGMKVSVTADGNPKIYHGTIGSIAPRAEFTPKTVETADLRTDLVYRMRIIVSDPDDALRQGQPVSIAVTDARPAKN
jgi:HlyD family secretion protein